MEYEVLDSSGTDDDLPPSYQNRNSRTGRVVGNGRCAVGSIAHSRMFGDMEIQIHSLEQEAYAAVLRAFKAQSDAITWEKEGLITDLRRELRVSDDEHRELLSRVNADETIRRIREWRESGAHQTAMLSTSQSIHDLLPSPAVSGSRKKQKTSQLVQSLPGLSSVKPIQYPPSGPANSRQYNSRASAVITTNTSAEAAEALIGRKIWTRWPDDNNFYEAVITDYNPTEGRHALVYDIHTTKETWEWVDLKQISPEDIRWEEDPSMSNRRGRGAPGSKKPFGRSSLPSSGRARVPSKTQPRRESLPSQNGALKKLPDDIELFNTDSLVKEVERVFTASNPDPVEIAKAKKMLKEHEQALVDAIARLGDASDGESDGGPGYAGGQSMEQL